MGGNDWHLDLRNGVQSCDRLLSSAKSAISARSCVSCRVGKKTALKGELKQLCWTVVKSRTHLKASDPPHLKPWLLSRYR